MPKLFVITGAAGSGKSTFGKALAARKSACILDSDTVTEDVVKAGMLASGMDPNDRDSPGYRRFFREAVYESLYQIALENLPHLDTVLVGPFTSEIQNPDWPVQLAEKFNSEVKVYFISCAESLRFERIKNRANPRDDWKVRHWQNYLAKSSTAPPAFDCQMIRT